MGVVLPKPIVTKSIERFANDHLNSGACSLNGFRSSFEDQHVLPDSDTTGPLLFGVFDGHANDKCSAFVAKCLPSSVLNAIRDDPRATFDSSHRRTLIENVCMNVDADFMRSNTDGGTTATFAIVETSGASGSGGGCDYNVTVCNVGDSRTMVVRRNRCIFVTEDHKPQHVGERQRIVSAGGSVRSGRVDGDLAVSRAFGDKYLKNPPMTEGEAPEAERRRQAFTSRVSCCPDVTYLRCRQGDMLLLCCDGVFEGAFPTEDVAAFAAHQLPAPEDDLAIVAGSIADQAVQRGSKDNVTAMVVRFEGREAFTPAQRFDLVPGPPCPKSHNPSLEVSRRVAQYHRDHMLAFEKRYAEANGMTDRGEGSIVGMPALLRSDPERYVEALRRALFIAYSAHGQLPVYDTVEVKDNGAVLHELELRPIMELGFELMEDTDLEVEKKHHFGHG